MLIFTIGEYSIIETFYLLQDLLYYNYNIIIIL